MNARHDASYKHLFSSPKVVQHLIEGFLPAAKRLGRLDFSTLEKVSASYVSDDLRERADDVIWRIKTDKDWLYFYFLIEFQSSVDPWMAVRLMYKLTFGHPLCHPPLGHPCSWFDAPGRIHYVFFQITS
jgi:predicted transposase/invertase (TIGR01784 family)